MKSLLTLRSHSGDAVIVFDNEDGSYEATSGLTVDVDGSPDYGRDPDGQSDTSLHLNGKPIDSDSVPGIVLPPECIKSVEPIVLGCQAQVSFRGVLVDAVVYDVGPHRKLGEGSAELARRLGVNDSPTRGGVSTPEVLYQWWPGKAALVDGTQYELQHYGS